jgi:hypothetical protein
MKTKPESAFSSKSKVYVINDDMFYNTLQKILVENCSNHCSQIAEFLAK